MIAAPFNSHRTWSCKMAATMKTHGAKENQNKWQLFSPECINMLPDNSIFIPSINADRTLIEALPRLYPGQFLHPHVLQTGLHWNQPAHTPPTPDYPQLPCFSMNAPDSSQSIGSRGWSLLSVHLFSSSFSSSSLSSHLSRSVDSSSQISAHYPPIPFQDGSTLVPRETGSMRVSSDLERESDRRKG